MAHATLEGLFYAFFISLFFLLVIDRRTAPGFFLTVPNFVG